MNNLQKIMELFSKMMAEKFWGEVTIKFKDGKVVMVQTTSQMKLD